MFDVPSPRPSIGSVRGSRTSYRFNPACAERRDSRQSPLQARPDKGSATAHDRARLLAADRTVGLQKHWEGCVCLPFADSKLSREQADQPPGRNHLVREST